MPNLELRNESTLETLRHCRILCHHIIEFLCGVHKLYVAQLERSELHGGVACRVPLIGDSCVEFRHLEVVWAVEQVAAESDGGPVEVAVAPFYKVGSKQTRESERGIQSELVGIEKAFASASCLPFIAGIELHTETFGATEEIIVGSVDVL